MRPRFLYGPQVELEQIGQALRRAYAPPPKPPAPARARFSLMPVAGSIVFILGIILAPMVLLGILADQSNRSCRPTPVIHRMQVGDYFIADLPDGRHIVATARSSERRWEDLPWTGNHIGDAKFVGDPYKFPIKGHWFVWMKPLGKTNATPTWIDP
jgi:hypothetical protein